MEQNAAMQASAAALEESKAMLQAYTRRLEDSHRELKDFAFYASHDLQEPLRKVQTFGARLEKEYGPALGETGRDYLERMRNAAARMQEMLKSLLAYSKIDAQGEMFQPVDLGQVAREVLNDLEPRLERSGGKVEIGPLPILQADPLQMRQLLQNLLSNALKFHLPGVAAEVKVYAQALTPQTPSPEYRKGGKELTTGITLTLSRNWERRAGSEGWVELVVEDNGIGFDPKLAGRLFQPFQRLVGRGEYEGHGMGLAICRKIVERHGGQIRVETEPGKGAIFVVTLPAGKP
jgi:signal transduction histidine kinase